MKKILLIEDEPGLLESLIAILDAHDFEVVAAATGNEALQAMHVHKGTLDLILCDINLPDISGYDLLKHAKGSDELYKVPFVFLTAYTDDKDVRTGMNMGADDYLTKPFTIKTLVDTINSRIELQADEHKKDDAAFGMHMQQIINRNFRQEFFTPINSILNTINLISAKEAGEGGVSADMLSTLYQSSFRMLRNSRNLVLYSMLTNDGASAIIPQYEAVRLDTLLDSIVANYTDLKHNRTLVTLENTGYPVTIPADQDLLSIVFTELIDNAVKFNNRCRPTVYLRAEGGNCSFSVTNHVSDGTYFTLHDVKPFRKMHEDSSYAGLGLGLYVAMAISAKCGPRLEMTTAADTVTFTLTMTEVAHPSGR